MNEAKFYDEECLIRRKTFLFVFKHKKSQTSLLKITFKITKNKLYHYLFILIGAFFSSTEHLEHTFETDKIVKQVRFMHYKEFSKKRIKLWLKLERKLNLTERAWLFDF